MTIIYFLVSGACGLLVGLSELLNRYKSFGRIFTNIYSWVYMTINILASLLVYTIIRVYGVKLGQIGDHEIGKCLFAGFAAMAFLRSSFFNFKDSSGKVMEVGPAAILTVFLRVAERQFSQRLSQTNVTACAKIMSSLPFLNASRELPIIMLNSHRIFSVEEQELLSQEILALVNNPSSNEEVKNIALGTILERYAGIEFLTIAVERLKDIYKPQKIQKELIEATQQNLINLKI